ncbi:MAG: glutamine--tRNA ligase/YqeY domain fusion protein [Planctomycetota bacterium]|nr:MAG: glutamine--tRNA ligase/YqeY domain fusion protein [Planctomycetota bacterium]
MTQPSPRPNAATDFIRDRIAADLASGKHSTVITRFPPEPNGYLHLGHAKSIFLNFGLAEEFGGRCHLRFDDTNPETEDPEYVESIQRDVRWLGCDWGDHLYFASDYFERLYELAEELIKAGKAYVDSSSEEEIRALRGTVTEPGRPSPYRDRSVEENLDLFRRMRAGEFPEGSHVLRAKIDLAAKNMKMRDPLLYRIRKRPHYRTGDTWCVYPFYDYTHCLSDAFEGITHSICTLEFENNRELYDWVIDNLREHLPARPEQIEFARLDLSYTVMSKRKLLQLVQEGIVAGWDDPRMPTLSGLRRRGVTPDALRTFCERIGVAKTNSTVDVQLFEHCVRDDLNHRAPRVMAVLDPLKVVITNYPEDRSEELDASYWPHDVPREGSRKVPFSRELFIERDDFREDPPKKYKRLAPGREVRLRYGYFIVCDEVIKDEAGRVVELRCTYDPATRGGAAPDGRSPKATLHWVSAAHAIDVEVRLYDRLFRAEVPGADGRDYHEDLNPDSLVVVRAKAEPSLATAGPGEHFQFERQGYFFADPVDTSPGAPVFNRTIGLRDSWAKRSQPKGSRPAAPSRPRREAPTGRSSAPRSRDDYLAGLPPAARERFLAFEARGLPWGDARTLATEPALADLFAEATRHHDDPRAVANWVVNDVARALKTRSELPFGGEALAELVELVATNRLSTKLARRVFEEMLASGERPAAIVERKGWRQLTDPAELRPLVEAVLAADPERVADYRGGKEKLLGYFLGQVMQRSGGQADPKTARELLRSALAEERGEAR